MRFTAWYQDESQKLTKSTGILEWNAEGAIHLAYENRGLNGRFLYTLGTVPNGNLREGGASFPTVIHLHHNNTSIVSLQLRLPAVNKTGLVQPARQAAPLTCYSCASSVALEYFSQSWGSPHFSLWTSSVLPFMVGVLESKSAR